MRPSVVSAVKLGAVSPIVSGMFILRLEVILRLVLRSASDVGSEATKDLLRVTRGLATERSQQILRCAQDDNHSTPLQHHLHRASPRTATRSAQTRSDP